MASGSLALVLHAHLPFVRHPEHPVFHEENWLFEALTESYVPLLQMMHRLLADAVSIKITFSITPTLCAMLDDTLLRDRYIGHLDRLIALTERELERANENVRPLAGFYREYFNRTRNVFVDEWNCDLLSIVRRLRDSGAIELTASGATHGILPILAKMPGAAESQIAAGCDDFREKFREDPAGFWLPECAYAPGIEKTLAAQNIRWFIIDAHGFERARPPAKLGTYAPCFTPVGPAAFGRNLSASRQVWSAESGYPGDPAYREFYRDIGFDLSRDELGPLANAQGGFTGIKYYRITGQGLTKEWYAPAAAQEAANRHAKHFVQERIAEIDATGTDATILTIPFDAELFGHWWFEGPIFLEQLAREAAERGLSLTTPSEYLTNFPTHQVLQPAPSSWGDKGHLDVWLDDKCSWIYPCLHAAHGRMQILAGSRTRSTDRERVLRQLGRELLLAEASDWAFLIRNGTATAYATQRVRDHLERFNRLADSLERKKIDRDFLAQCEEKDNLFPALNWRHFRIKRAAQRNRNAGQSEFH